MEMKAGSGSVCRVVSNGNRKAGCEMVTIRDCGIDPEIRDLVPAHSWQESAELGVSVERFGYLAPILAWKNPAGELVVIDGHKRRELWLSACRAAQKTGGGIPVAPQVRELPFDSRDAAMLFVIDNATGRQNLSSGSGSWWLIRVPLPTRMSI